MENPIAKYFPVFYTEHDYLERSYGSLQPFGFHTDNVISAVCICRDEISQSLMEGVKRHWGAPFNMAGLAGVFISGKTALKAAIHHAPMDSDRLRYVFYALPHIAIGKNGELGSCTRRGIEQSTACGALVAFHAELMAKKVNLLANDDDEEMNSLRRRLISAIPFGETPDLLNLTRLTRAVIQQDIERVITKTVDTGSSDYALFTGLQVHAPDGLNYIVPDVSYAIVGKVRHDLRL
jgi:hypothetical protein